jgi:hypothetical protein
LINREAEFARTYELVIAGLDPAIHQSRKNFDRACYEE